MHQPPNSTDLERGVLGGILREGDLFREVYAKLPGVEYFYDGKHKSIYKAMIQLHRAGEPVDLVTTAAELDNMGKLASVGGRAYLAEVLDYGDYRSSIGVQAEKLRNLYELRSMIPILQGAVESAYTKAESADVLVSQLTQSLVPLVTRNADRGFALLGDFARQALEIMHNQPDRMTGLRFGYEELDKLTGGMQNGDLIIIAGRPRMGKTAFMNCISSKQAEDGLCSAFFSAETRGREFAIRALCTDALVDSMQFKCGRLGETSLRQLNLSWNKLTGWNYWLNDTPEIEINELVGQACLIREKEKVDIIYVDYLQKLSAAGTFNSRRDKTDYIVHALKKLAQQLDIPVVVACQLSRNLENRQNKIPILADLKETGSIEQEADLILALHRPELYIKKKKKDETRVKNLNECYFLKQRNGPAGMKVDLFFDVVHTRFEEMPKEYEPVTPY